MQGLGCRVQGLGFRSWGVAGFPGSAKLSIRLRTQSSGSHPSGSCRGPCAKEFHWGMLHLLDTRLNGILYVCMCIPSHIYIYIYIYIYI